MDAQKIFRRVDSIPCTATQWIVDGVIEADEMHMLFGQSGHGKSFWSIALACCVATGAPFFGHEIETEGSVLYVAQEGGRGLRHRVQAWIQRHDAGALDCRLYLSQAPVFLGLDSTGRDALIQEAAQIADQDAPVRLVVIDTVNRTMLGEENNAADMAAFLRDVELIRAELGGPAVLLDHHSGWNNTGRARGHSSLHAAVGVEYCIARDDAGQFIVSNTKSRDSKPCDPMAFAIEAETVRMFGTEQTEEIGVLVSTEYHEPERARQPGKLEQAALSKLWEMEDQNGGGPTLVSEWRDASGMIKQRFYDAKRGLIKRGAVTISNGYVLAVR